MVITLKKIIASLLSLGVLSVSGYFISLNQKFAQAGQKGEIEQLADIENKVLGYEKENSEIQSLLQLTTNNETEKNNEENKNFNILGIGKSGNLTDSIVVASINEEKKKITLISIPRDVAVDGMKINHFNYYYGIEKLKEKIEQITGLKIDRYGLVNFDGFRALINAVDGIDVKVTEEIKDYNYDYFIEPGQYHFTGQEALRYSRSRYTTSDFDRAKRQQQVVEAFVDKIKQINLLDNPEKAFEIYGALKNNFETDISIWEALDIYNKYKDFEIARENVLSTANYLYSKLNESGAYILLPKTGNFKQIQGFIDGLVK